MAVARDDLGRAARKRGIDGQVTIIRQFGIRCIYEYHIFELRKYVVSITAMIFFLCNSYFRSSNI